MRGAEISIADWQVWIQIGAFAFIFLTFCIFTIRTLLMKRDRENQLASMPLEDESKSEPVSTPRNSKEPATANPANPSDPR